MNDEPHVTISRAKLADSLHSSEAIFDTGNVFYIDGHPPEDEAGKPLLEAKLVELAASLDMPVEDVRRGIFAKPTDAMRDGEADISFEQLSELMSVSTSDADTEEDAEAKREAELEEVAEKAEAELEEIAELGELAGLDKIPKAEVAPEKSPPKPAPPSSAAWPVTKKLDYDPVVHQALEWATRISPATALEKLTKSGGTVRTARELFSPNGEKKRSILLAVHFAANQHGLIAPYFRRQTFEQITQFGGEYGDAKQQLKNDELLTDIDWMLRRLIEQGRTSSFKFKCGKYGEFELMRSGEINWADLCRYSEIERKTKYRLEDLKLNEVKSEQILYTTLHGKEVYDLKKNVQSGMKRMTNGHAAWQRCHPGRHPPVAERVHRWQMLRLAGGDPAAAAELEHLKLGEKVPGNRVRIFKDEVTDWYPTHMPRERFPSLEATA